MKGIIVLASSLLMDEEAAASATQGVTQSSQVHFKALLGS